MVLVLAVIGVVVAVAVVVAIEAVVVAEGTYNRQGGAPLRFNHVLLLFSRLRLMPP